MDPVPTALTFSYGETTYTLRKLRVIKRLTPAANFWFYDFLRYLRANDFDVPDAPDIDETFISPKKTCKSSSVSSPSTTVPVSNTFAVLAPPTVVMDTSATAPPSDNLHWFSSGLFRPSPLRLLIHLLLRNFVLSFIRTLRSTTGLTDYAFAPVLSRNTSLFLTLSTPSCPRFCQECSSWLTAVYARSGYQTCSSRQGTMCPSSPSALEVHSIFRGNLVQDSPIRLVCLP